MFPDQYQKGMRIEPDSPLFRRLSWNIGFLWSCDWTQKQIAEELGMPRSRVVWFFRKERELDASCRAVYAAAYARQVAELVSK